MEKNRIASLSWLVVSTRDYKKEYDWFWDDLHQCCYGIPKEERTDNLQRDLARYYESVSSKEEYYARCILMPELQDLDKSEAADFLRNWCNENQISYREDLDRLAQVEQGYWGYDDNIDGLFVTGGMK